MDVTLIDRHTYNTFQPLLYQVATATLNPGDITWFLRSIRTHQQNVRFLKGTVVSMDHAGRTVALDGGQSVGYDYLIISAGVTANFFGVPGAPEHSMPLYRRTQALALRDRVFAVLEEAVINGRNRDLRIVVVGGGATGVEMAGALTELRDNDLHVTYPELTPARVHITLIDRQSFLLEPFHPTLREYARRSLQRRGVDLRLDTPVKQVRPDGVIIGDQVFLPADIVVWASGVRVHDQVARWNVPQGRDGRITVDDHLRVDGLNGVFAVGDIAVEAGDRALPQLAQPAPERHICCRAVEGNAGRQAGHVVRIPRQGHTRDDRTELGGRAGQRTSEADGCCRLGPLDRRSCVLPAGQPQSARHDAELERQVHVLASQSQRDRRRDPDDHPGSSGAPRPFTPSPT